MFNNVIGELDSLTYLVFGIVILFGMILPSVSDSIRDNRTIGPRIFNILVLITGYVGIIYLYLKIGNVEANIVINTIIFVLLIPTYGRVKDVIHIGHKATTYLLLFGFSLSWLIFLSLGYIETVNRLYLIVILGAIQLALEVVFAVIRKVKYSKRIKNTKEKYFEVSETHLDEGYYNGEVPLDEYLPDEEE